MAASSFEARFIHLVQKMNCDVGNILGDIALAKISQESHGRLVELNGQYAHAKRRIGNIPIFDPCEGKFKSISV